MTQQKYRNYNPPKKNVKKKQKILGFKKSRYLSRFPNSVEA